ncbi:uncharacterized protein J8A68_000433 [[Candida] subhashii]|uniref:Uncharacterized protein n=1 Tax=[Candida] subhashii TaxID=561895 RepID=A0A8J5UMC1_9ASCO|nr:uncharacterized protein J8A68_000433 [[Candida] subhashii]KAG7666003.1 hypothetical protein J8A68_000433 [[Candida] subhashii]
MSAEDIEPPPPAYFVDRELPSYDEVAANRGWNFVIRNAVTGAGFNIFVSKNSYQTYLEMNKETSEDVVRQKILQGLGIPMFRVTGSLGAINMKPLTFKKYVPDNERPFNVHKDYKTFCVVKKKVHIGYNSYVFRFTPKPENPKEDFQIVMFSHSILPISDYIYNGETHRWVHEDYHHVYQYRHTRLEKNQPALTDTWDMHSTKLHKIGSPFFQNSKFMNTFKRETHNTREFYGTGSKSTLNMTSVNTISGYAELRVKIPTLISNTEDISEVSLDELVKICVATVLKYDRV